MYISLHVYFQTSSKGAGDQWSVVTIATITMVNCRLQELYQNVFLFLFMMRWDITVMILSFRTDMPGQTVQTQIRLLLIRVDTVCHSVCIVWTHYSMVEPHSSNFRVIRTIFLGVQIFRKFTVHLPWDIFITFEWSIRTHFALFKILLLKTVLYFILYPTDGISLVS